MYDKDSDEFFLDKFNLVLKSKPPKHVSNNAFWREERNKWLVKKKHLHFLCQDGERHNNVDYAQTIYDLNGIDDKKGFLVEVVHIDEPQRRAYRWYKEDYLTIKSEAGKSLELRGAKLFKFLDWSHKLEGSGEDIENMYFEKTPAAFWE